LIKRGDIMDLRVNFMDLSLKNPIIVAAGPWTRNASMIKKAIDAGAGAIVTETILTQVRPNVRPRLVAKGQSMQNIRLYSDLALEEWEREIYTIKDYGGTVIASILAHSPSEMAYIAGRVEKFGADAIELGVASPHGEGIEVLSSNTDQIFNITKSVCQSVNIPVMVKLSPHATNIHKIGKAVEKAGASAISAIDTVRSILGVDINTGKPLLPTYGGYSGDAIRPIGLATVATLSQSTAIDICGIGGIGTYEHALEYMMLGATAVQIGTALILQGYDVIPRILDDLATWLNESEYSNLNDLRGKALKSLKSFEEIDVIPKKAHVHNPCPLATCNACVKTCFYDAISKSADQISIHDMACTGCGICLSVCPEKLFELKW